MIIQRRQLLIGALGLLAAPAIVRAESLMKLHLPKRYILRAPDVIDVVQHGDFMLKITPLMGNLVPGMTLAGIGIPSAVVTSVLPDGTAIIRI